MPFSATSGGAITKADLDLLAIEANRVLTPQDMYRTPDVQTGLAPALMASTDAFSFSDETETYYSPLGHPVLKAAPRWAWVDELNRIWKCLWNIPNSGYAPFGVDSWDIGTGGAATDMITAYWGLQSAPGLGSLDEIVISPGPHCYTTTAPASFPEQYVPVYQFPRAIYSRREPDFDIVSGLFTTYHEEDGDNAAHSNASPFSAEMITAGANPTLSSGLYGYYEVEYTRTGGSPGDPRGSGHGVYLQVPPGGTTGQFETHWDGADKLYMWLDADFSGESGWRKMHHIYIPGSSLPPDTGSTFFRSYVNEAGWVYTKTRYILGVYQAEAHRDDGAFTGDNVIHPRNKSVKDLLHLTTDPNLIDPDDILDFPNLDALLSNPGIGTRYIDTIMRSMFAQATTDALDDYPAPDPDPTTPRALMVNDMNSVINGTADGNSYNLWIEEARTMVLRPGTRWMLERGSTEPTFVRAMNRRLIEDIYAPPNAGTTMIRKLTSTSLEAANEILSLDLSFTTVGTGTFQGFPMIAGSYFCTNPEAKVIYMGLGLPQWCSQTFLDLDMPNGTPNENLMQGGTLSGPRGIARWSADSSAWGQPAISPVASCYPILHVKWFGTRQAATSREEQADKAISGYVPFWRNDEKHGWLVYPAGQALAPGEHTFNAETMFIAQDSVANGLRYEYTVSNPSLRIYVSRSDFPIPTDPSTYEFVSDKGQFIFPDDFTAPAAVEGGELWVTIQNNTATQQTWQVVQSAFTPAAGESPPLCEPNFFTPNEAQIYKNYANFVNEGSSYRFGPYLGIAIPVGENINTGTIFPTPQRGYHVRELVVTRKPVLNAAGIYVPPDAADCEARTVYIGLMAGAGVSAGAIYGSYPGDWLEFETLTMGAGVVTARFPVTYPVLEGCPLAYYVTDGSIESAEEFEIFASVEFAPVANNAFVAESYDAATGFTQGGFYGAPYLSNTFLWQDNQNNNYNNTAGPRWRPNNICSPPHAARAIKQLYDFLQALP